MGLTQMGLNANGATDSWSTAPLRLAMEEENRRLLLYRTYDIGCVRFDPFKRFFEILRIRA